MTVSPFDQVTQITLLYVLSPLGYFQFFLQQEVGVVNFFLWVSHLWTCHPIACPWVVCGKLHAGMVAITTDCIVSTQLYGKELSQWQCSWHSNGFTLTSPIVLLNLQETINSIKKKNLRRIDFDDYVCILRNLKSFLLRVAPLVTHKSKYFNSPPHQQCIQV